MPVSALLLLLLAALLHASWNIAAKKAGGGDHFVLMVALLLVALWAPLALIVSWDVLPRWGALEWGVVTLSGVVHLVYFRTLLRGYREADLTVVYPVARGTGPLLTSLAAVVLLQEHLSALGALGVLAVTGGVFLIAGGPALWRQAHDPVRRSRVHKGIVWGTCTGVLIAGYTVIDGYAVKAMALSPILVDYFGNVARIPFMLPAALRDPQAFGASWRAQWKHALLLAAISPLAYVLALYAMRLAPLSHVAPARELSMLFAALLGGKLLGEGDRAQRLAGALCIALGVAALALG